MRFLIYIIISVLVSIQVVVSPNKSILSQSELELVEQQKRMNDYPSQYFRLANILEQRKESRLIYKLEDNFFKIFKVDSIWNVLIPVSLIGFFWLIRRKEYLLLLIGLGLPVIVLTILGQNQKWGSFCLYPFLIISVYYGVAKIFKRV